jgi:hypothetical protein
MSDLEKIAKASATDVSASILEQLKDEGPEDLERLILLAREQEPPNELILGAIGATAYLNSVKDQGLDKPQYSAVARLVFPQAPLRHRTMSIGDGGW